MTKMLLLKDLCLSIIFEPKIMFMIRIITTQPLYRNETHVRALYKTSQVLFAGVPGVFSLGSNVFAHLLIGPSIQAEIILKGH